MYSVSYCRDRCPLAPSHGKITQGSGLLYFTRFVNIKGISPFLCSSAQGIDLTASEKPGRTIVKDSKDILQRGLILVVTLVHYILDAFEFIRVIALGHHS